MTEQPESPTSLVSNIPELLAASTTDTTRDNTAAGTMENAAHGASTSVLPPLPDDSIDFSVASMSQLPTSQHLPSDDSVLLERNVKNQLRDIESSFIPDDSPASHALPHGIDDTYLFGGSPGRMDRLSKTPADQTIAEEAENSRSSSRKPTDSATASTVLSSPAADAMRRNTNRSTNGPARSTAPEFAGVSGGTQYQTTSDEAESLLSDSAGTASQSRLSRRPVFLRNRQSSQHSSVSSLLAPSDISGDTDHTLGVDFGLPSDGVIASDTEIVMNGLTGISLQADRRIGHPLGRVRPIETNLGSLDEEGPATPRVGSSIMTAPSDTVIARHIRDIQVPDTIAREYRAKHSSTRSPERRKMIGMSVSARSSKNLTLKDTNDKIDKLSKENFDLKLKIHFLDVALQQRSDDGVKDMIAQNVKLQVDLANAHKDNQSLRRKIRDLERKVKTQDESNQSPKISDFDDGNSSGDEAKAEMEEEITYLRETVQHLQTETERLRSESLHKEMEKRKLAEYVKSISEARHNGSSVIEEKDEMWKELVEAETARREAADEDAEKLREEIRKLKAAAQASNNTNVYNITKRSYAYTRPEIISPEADHERNGAESRASTLVDQLKTEKADMKQEIVQLRRDLSAQTSMLTSRNKERERLQQEIEELKLQSRRGGMDGARSIAGDSIFDRSVSRAHQRSSSRASGTTRVTRASDAEHDDAEKQLNAMRDELAQVKMLNQDLENALNEQLDTVEILETDLERLRSEGELALDDLQQLQQERDDLLSSVQDKDNEFEVLRAQAVENIDKLEEELDQKTADFSTLQGDLKNASETVVLLEDELQAGRRKEDSLSQQLEDAEREIEDLANKLEVLGSKHERLEVQLENSQNEASFLREEQEGDKLKIGELEACVATAQGQVDDLLAQAALERRQREALDSEEKAQIQAALDELNAQNASDREDIRILRKKLEDKEKEARTWQSHYQTLETNLIDLLGDVDGTSASIVKNVTKLQRDLDHTLSALEIARQDLNEKDMTLRARDALLESSGLETRKLSELLDKERQLRRADKASFESIQRSQQSLTRTLQQNDTRVFDIEQARQMDRRKFVGLQQQLKDQITQRNNLLFTLWNRMATLCGRDFIQKHLFDGDESPTSEFLSANLAEFSKNVAAALKTLEAIINSSRAQIRNLERSFTNEFANLERALEHRTKRIDLLEKSMTHSDQGHQEYSDNRGQSRDSNDDGFVTLQNENKLLKAEVLILRNTSPVREPVVDKGASRHSRRESNLARHHSSSAVEGVRLHEKVSRPSHVAVDPTLTVPANSIPLRTESLRNHSPAASIRRSSLHHQNSSVSAGAVGGHSRQPSSTANGPGMQASEQRWVLRLKELERRLKAEREARLLDRSGARKRIEESEAENESLRLRLEREMVRRQSTDSTSRPVEVEEDMLDRGLNDINAV